MPLVPPGPVVEHPADLVIDVFGTFLGKRSERMIVRWRDQGDGPSSQSPRISPRIVKFAHNCDESGERDTQSSKVADSEPTTRPAAEGAAERLLELWSGDAGEESQQAEMSPSARLNAQLDRLAEDEGRPTAPGWKERHLPFSRLRSVTIAGRGVTISTDLIESLVERGVALSFLSRRGTPIAHLSAPGLNGTVQTRRSQLAAYHSALGVELAIAFVRGKLCNQKHQLQYSGKYLKSADQPRFERLQKKIAAIGNLRRQLQNLTGDQLDDVRDRLMGLEGTGARLYWEGVAIILAGRVEFAGRTTRGAIDPVNSALNYGYGILYSQVSAAVVNAGLELFAGFLHVDRPGKPALVLDLVEEFRAPVVDRAVLAIVNQGISLDVDEHGMTAATRRLVADRVLQRLQTPVPYEGKRWALSVVIQTQARHLAVAVRGERTYRPFISRW